MYEEYANRREPVERGQRGRCAHCAFLNISTASEYEWPCPILRGWICETHCCEIQLPGGTQTRERVAAQIGWAAPPDTLLGVCRDCPYGDTARKNP